MKKFKKKNSSLIENKKIKEKESEIMKKIKDFFLNISFYSIESQKTLLTLFLIVSAVIIFLSFFNLAGQGGETIKFFLTNLYGNLVYFIPFLLLFLTIFIKLKSPKIFVFSIFPLFLFFTFLLSALLTIVNLNGGKIGYLISSPLILVFDRFASTIILLILIAVFFIFCYRFLSPELLKLNLTLESIKKYWTRQKTYLPPIGQFKKVERENFKRKDTPFNLKKDDNIEEGVKQESQEDKRLTLSQVNSESSLRNKKKNNGYESPPINLLTKEKENLVVGNIEENQKIIKKTLENFNIPVEMSSVNIGPTVTQYTLKPIKGIKLSKIVGLSNDLALALAAHPIRIEAPVPGKSLVGIEVPNKTRTKVTLRGLLEEENLKKIQDKDATAIFDDHSFYIPIGRDIVGIPVYFNLFKMPHLLVAGATGTGKTCAANTLMFTEKGLLTFEELYSLPLNSEVNFEIKVVSRDGIETTKKIYNNGICQFYKISTSRGYQVEATFEHPLWVINKDGSQEWKAASLIKEGDYVAISRGPALFGNKIDISDFQPSRIRGNTKKISFPSRITPQLAQFLGFLTADGGLSIERKGIHRVTYTQANIDLLSLYKKSLEELFGITQFIGETSGSNPNNKAKEIVVNSMHLKEFLSYLGMESVKSPQKVIPKAIREAPKEIVIAYLQALFDNDGYAGKNSIEITLSSEKLISQIQIMLLNFGIISSLKTKKVKNYAQNEYFRLIIYGEEARKFIKKIGFVRKEKCEKIKKLFELSSNPNTDIVPHISFLLKTLAHKYLNHFARLTNKGWQYQSGILIPKYTFASLRSYNSGNRMPSYQAMKKILDFYQPISKEIEYQKLNEIFEKNFYWDRVEKITRTSGVGYDFFVPGSDSFVGNGFVNHNTVFLNSLITSLIFKNSPDILKLILIDPKRVEFANYNDLPHLLCPVISNPQKAISTLNWLIIEMERRFDMLLELGVRDIGTYNKNIREKNGSNGESNEVMPYIVLILDELADLMNVSGKELELKIMRLAQKARAVGIHLVLATQRPSVNVITGVIKANIVARIAFTVVSQVDSRTILDCVGAEKLTGAGDMLFMSPTSPYPKRIQGAYISEKETDKIVEWISQNIKRKEDLADSLLNSLGDVLSGNYDSDSQINLQADSKQDILFYDPLYEEAKQIIIDSDRASTSLLQRRLKIGYARAARLIDAMEQKGVVGPARGSKPRKILIKKENQN